MASIALPKMRFNPIPPPFSSIPPMRKAQWVYKEVLSSIEALYYEGVYYFQRGKTFAFHPGRLGLATKTLSTKMILLRHGYHAIYLPNVLARLVSKY